MRTNKNTSKIILATTVALLAMVISYLTFNNMNSQLTDQQQLINAMQKTKSAQNTNNFAYAVATGNLKAGEIVSDEDVDFQQFQAINTGAFENRSDVVNKILLQDISSGEVFTNAHIAQISKDNVSLKEGYRALTLPADSFQGRSDKMIAGSSVDIFSSAADSDWVMENVRIIGFEAGNSSSASTAKVGMTGATSITFEVLASNISSFISNISKNKLVLVARSAKDKKVLHKKPSHSYGSDYGGSSMSSLPNIPATVPIGNLPQESNLSGLPQPIQPTVQSDAVEVIEANVKSKVTFD